MKITFADRLKELRGSLSQSDFAYKIRAKQTSYSSWERGVKEPGISIVVEIANAFGVSADWLLGLSDVRAPLIEAPRQNNVSKIHEKQEKFPSFGRPICSTVRQRDRTLNPEEISDILCNLRNEITQLKTQISALQSTSIATCG